MTISCNRGDEHYHHHNQVSEKEQIHNQLNSMSLGGASILQSFVDKFSNDQMTKRESSSHSKRVISQGDCIESKDNAGFPLTFGTPKISCNQM